MSQDEPERPSWYWDIFQGIFGPEYGWTHDEEHREGQRKAKAALDSLLENGIPADVAE